ncbi:hypothetical protein GCM10010495_26680 [Kitasatospora herbaricolor]|nr:hypothetical protein GCM10010495_26680 [Kitasatospora herbaricolor]
MPTAVRPLPLLEAADCERAFRPLGAERRCAPCRQRAAAASAGAGGSAGGSGWRERLAAVAAQ